MPVKVITQEISNRMKEMSATMTVKQIANELNLNYTTAHHHMKEWSGRKLGKTPRVRGPRTKDKNREGIFNVNAKDNWLV